MNWIIRLAVQESKKGVASGRITILNAHAIDRNLVFHAQPFHVRSLEGASRAVSQRRKMSCSESMFATPPQGGVHKLETLQASCFRLRPARQLHIICSQNLRHIHSNFWPEGALQEETLYQRCLQVPRYARVRRRSNGMVVTMANNR